MRSFLVCAILAAFGLRASAAALNRRSHSPKYSSLVVFGDSFSDNGNAYRLTNNSWPADPAYYAGHFSNGPVWADILATNMSLPEFNYAYGGTTTSNSLVQGFTGAKSDVPVPSMADQVQDYLSSAGKDGVPPINGSLLVLFGGANDVFFNPNISATQSVGVISGLLTTLVNAGASEILLINSPDLSQIPYDSYADATARSQLRDFSVLLGQGLKQVAHSAGVSSTTVRIGFVDLIPLFRSFGFYEQGWKAPGFDQFGLYGSCLVGAYAETSTRSLCADADKHVFWDEYHPTRVGHRLIAGEILKLLS